MMNNEKNKDIIQDQFEINTMNENQLDDVSGGIWLPHASKNTSGPEPKYKEGQVVLGDFYIVKVNKTDGVFDGTYYVVSAFNHNKVFSTAMDESVLERMERNEAARL